MAVPSWKVKRELRRIWLQFRDRFSWPFPAVKQFVYDLSFPTKLTVAVGHYPIGAKVALFVIYQPKGLARSVLVTCRHLLSIGYSTIIVSNGQLSDADRADLLEVSSLFVERPNYGYDFGGYRDGLRLMKLRGISPETLIIMNDSIWYPILPQSNMVETLEADPSGFTGPMYEWSAHRGDQNAHYQSYFYVIQKKVLQHRAFDEYWRRYPLSSEKRLVLISGEKGFTRHLNKRGVITRAKATRALMLERLNQQDAAYLKRTLDYAVYETAELLQEALDLIASYADNEAWRAKALEHMSRALLRAQPQGSYPYAAFTIMPFDLLKKSGYPEIFFGMRWQYLRLVRDGHLPPPAPEVLAELEVSAMDGSMTTDPSVPRGTSATHRP